MTLELTILAWTLVLAIVQILLPAVLRTSETGVDYNASARDAPSTAPVGKITGRLLRAQQNLFETLPLFAAAISKFFTRPVFSQRSKEAGIVTV